MPCTRWFGLAARFRSRLIRFIVIAFAVAHGSLPASGAETVDARLDALEQRLAQLAAENESLRERLRGKETGRAATAVSAAGRETSLSVGGFLQAQAESGDAPDARFNGIADRVLLRRARLFLAGGFAESVAFKMEADFGNNTLGVKPSAAGQLTDVYAAWTKHPMACVRFGQFKTPFGYEQLASDTKIYTAERALPSDRLTLGRQIGIMLHGGDGKKPLHYAIGAFNGTGTNFGGNDNDKFLWVGRAGARLARAKLGRAELKWDLGAGYFRTQDTGSFTGTREGFGVDTQIALGRAELQGEWLRNDLQPRVGRETRSEGWSLLGSWKFHRQWQGVLRYETYHANARVGTSETELWTVGVDFLLKGDDLKLSLNYLDGQPPAPAAGGGRVIGRMQVVF